MMSKLLRTVYQMQNVDDEVEVDSVGVDSCHGVPHWQAVSVLVHITLSDKYNCVKLLILYMCTIVLKLLMLLLLLLLLLLHCGPQKTCHFILDYNFHVSWGIFTLLVPTETGMNTLQSRYKIYNFTVASTFPHYQVKLKPHKTSILKSVVTVFYYSIARISLWAKWAVFKSCAT